MGHYATAEVCLNGHPTTDNVQRSYERRSKHCGKCGAKTISVCQNCHADIRGDYVVHGVIVIGSEYTPPSYCHECGTAFPWTAEAISAASQIVDDSDLSEDDSEALKTAIEELTKDTPKTPAAALRYRKLAAKAGSVFGEGLNKIIVSVATEAAKKLIGL